MKKIEIQGKRNQDKMKQMADPDAILEKNIPKKNKRNLKKNWKKNVLLLEFPT